MYAKIKEMADEAIALQNKNRMDEVLREISGMCSKAEVATQALIAEQRDRLADADGNSSVSHSDEADPAQAKAKKGGAK